MPSPIALPKALHRDERGGGLVLVLVLSLVLASIATVTLSSAASSRSLVHKDQAWHAALAAAEAGLDDYLYRLNRNDQYWAFTTTASSPDSNPALSGWTRVPGGAASGEFQYTVNSSEIGAGNVRLTVRGRAPGVPVDGTPTWVERTVQATLRRSGFLDFLYFSDYETMDPVTYATAAQRQTAEQQCGRYLWASPTRPVNTSAPCLPIYFRTGEVINGPFHTNDRFLTDGTPTFAGPASSSASPGALYEGRNGTPNFQPGSPFYQPARRMPPSNTALRTEADHTLGKTGCLYTGPTQIRIRDDRMLVRSPYTKSTGPGCGAFPTTAQVSVPLPANGVVYVQNVPASGPNAHTGSCPSGGNGLGYPISGEAATTGITYSCRDGDAFVEGTISGRLTIGAENHVFAIWHIRRKDPSPTSTDILGLIANNFVWIYHPVNSSGTNLVIPTANGVGGTTFRDVELDAAVLSVSHSFMVMNYNRGAALGTLTVNGSIAQVFRGPVGTFSGTTLSTGYDKRYYYDTRLRFLSPPHFIDPVAAQWRVNTWSEQ